MDTGEDTGNTGGVDIRQLSILGLRDRIFTDYSDVRRTYGKAGKGQRGQKHVIDLGPILARLFVQMDPTNWLESGRTLIRGSTMPRLRMRSTFVVLIGISGVAFFLFRVKGGKLQTALSMKGHLKPVDALAFSSDNVTLAVASSKASEVQVWDTERRSMKYSIKTAGGVSQLLFTASGDMITSAHDVRAWDDRGRLKWVSHPFRRPGSRPVYCPETHTTAVAFDNAVGKGSELVLQNSNNGLHHLEFAGRLFAELTTTSNGRFLALGTSDPDISDAIDTYLIDLSEGTVRSHFRIPDLPDRVELSPDGRYLAAWWQNEAMQIQMWDTKAGTLRSRMIVRIKASMSDVSFSPDGKTLAAAAGDRTSSLVPIVRSLDRIYGEVRLWDVATGENFNTLETEVPVTRVAYSPDGRTLAAGCDDGTIYLWHSQIQKP